MKYETWGIILTIIGGALWGLSGTSGQFLLQERGVTSEWLVTIRIVTAGLITIVWAYLREKEKIFRIWHQPKDILKLFIFGIGGLALCQYAYFTSIRYSNAGIATVIEYTGPAMIILYIALRHHQWPTAREGMALTFAMIGTFLLATHGSFDSLALPKEALLWGVVAALSLALYNVQPVQLLHIYGTMPIVGYGMILGGTVMLFLFPPYPIVGHWDFMAVMSMLTVIVLGTVVSFTLYLEGVKRIGPARSSILSSCEPISATIFSAALLGTTFSIIDILGFAFILSTVFLIAGEKKCT